MMGYETFIHKENSLASKYRDQFPVTEKLVYLNHAAVAPLSLRSAEAMKKLADDVLRYGSYHYEQWLDAYQGVRDASSRLIGADPAEIAIVKNTSEGIATVAGGLNWRAGDKVVAFQEEFPANYFPWKRLEEEMGVEIRWLSVSDTLDAIDRAAQGARLLAISFVQYLSGHRANLEAIGEICHRRGVLFFVDAIQGLGAFPLDVRKSRIHALSADGHKWLLGPEGCGILYIHRDLQDSVQPVEFGWTNVARYNDYASRDMSLRPDAGRYECGTLNTIGCFGLRAALEFILEVGVDNIALAVRELGDAVADGARQKGYSLCLDRTEANAAGIVSIQKANVDSRLLVRHLKERGFLAAPRQGWVRVSPHFYITREEIERFVDALP
jgi:selenocysteine lyase/cysteine desulfurase